MIDFATLQGLTIPEGVVTKIESGGVVLWVLKTGEPVTIILEVEKITSGTYAAETAYNNESFILLDIYPKTNGTIKVTYGGLTKTVTDTSGAEEPNAQQVFFGTFNGVTDDVETPASGTLVINGDCVAFGCGQFAMSTKSAQSSCSCIIGVNDISCMSAIPPNAFATCSKLTIQELPEGVEAIGDAAFTMKATSLNYGGSEYGVTWTTAMKGSTITLPSTIKSIGARAFTSSNSVRNENSNANPCYLAKVRILATEPPVLGENAFGDDRYFKSNSQSKVGTFEVPKGSAEAYKAAESWSKYVGRIVEVS